MEMMMQMVFENRTTIVTYIDNGHLLHIDHTTGQLYRSRKTWKDCDSAKRAYDEPMRCSRYERRGLLRSTYRFSLHGQHFGPLPDERVVQARRQS
jgi:hypothetical protein